MKQDHGGNLSRRGFLVRGVSGAAAVGLAKLLGRPARAAAAQPAKPAKPSITAYADNLDALRKTDPKLIHYQQSGRVPSPHKEPKRIQVGPDGRLYVAAGKWITLLDREGGQLGELSLRDEARCLCVASDGTVYVGLRDHVEVYDAQGARRAAWDSPAKKTWLTALAVGENNLFASDAGNRTVYRFDRSGKLVRRIGEKDKKRDIPGFMVPSPYFDLKIVQDGLLWVVNPGHHRFEAYTFDGGLEVTWGEASFGVAGFCGCCNPSYFARLPDGRFVTSEKGLTRIKVYSAKGEFESVVAGPEAFPKYSENLNATPIPVDVAVDSVGRVYVADTLGNEIRIYQRKDNV